MQFYIMYALWALLLFSAVKPTQGPSQISPIGLVNKGNSCFINAALQAFMAATDLSPATLKMNSSGIPGSLLTIMEEVIKSYQHSSGAPFYPEKLNHKIWNLLGTPVNSQDDTNYALTTLLDHISDVDIKPSAKKSYYLYDGTKIPKTPLSKLFYIESVSVLKPDPNKTFQI